jgi:SAM-dependent methyltransferase
LRGITKTKEVNINTPEFWNSKWGTHGGGERNDAERFKPIARKAWGRALDVGCSFGHLCNYLYERGCDEVYGVDFSREALLKAKRNYPFCTFVVADANFLPFKNDCFDSVTVAETLEHLDDYRAGLREALRVAETVIFTVPDSSVYDEHVWTFTMEGVENLVDGSGYCERVASKWLMGVMESD